MYLWCRYGPSGSAICVYSADMSGMKDKGIFDIFSEEYSNLRPGRTGCTANNIPNDNPFTVSPYIRLDIGKPTKMSYLAYSILLTS